MTLPKMVSISALPLFIEGVRRSREGVLERNGLWTTFSFLVSSKIYEMLLYRFGCWREEDAKSITRD